MATEAKLPITKEQASVGEVWRPFEALRREVDHLFDDFWRHPFRSVSVSGLNRDWSNNVAAVPAVDVSEGDKAYEITAELPGLDEKDIEVGLANGGLTIKGEKKAEKEEKKKDYYVSERSFGSFQRYFGLPEGVDTNKIEATFKNGVLKVILPKTAEAQKAAKKIEVKAA